MNMLIKVVALLFLAAAVYSKLCCELPTTIIDDARISLEPYGSKWQIRQTNVNKTGDRIKAVLRNCLNGQYIGNLNGNASIATILFINRKMGFHSVAKEIVNDEMTIWTLYTDDGKETAYRKLMYKGNGEDSYFGLYICDPKGIYIEDLMMFAMTDKGKKAMDKERRQSFPDLPLHPDQKLTEVYTNCSNTKPLC